MATPPFFPGMSGAGQMPQVPTGTPQAPGQPPQGMEQLLKMILQGAQPKPHLANPTAPAPIPPEAGQPQQQHGRGSGVPNLITGITAGIQNAVHYDKQKKLAAATSDWNDLITSTQKYMKEDGTMDEKAYTDPAVMQILGDPKKLKLMAKSLNQDWLNPKPDLYADARKVALQQHSEKQGALQGLKQTVGSMLQRIRGQGQQSPQVSPEQRQGMAKDVMSRAPVQQAGGTDPAQAASSMKAFAELQNSQANLTRAQTEAHDKYQIQATGSGSLVAIDKNDPTKVIPITDAKGNPVTAAPKGVQTGSKPALVNGVPIGVTKSVNGKTQTVLPGSPNWTGEDAAIFQAATGATAASNASKDHRVALAAETRAQAFGKIREYGVMDTETNSLVTVDPDTMNANPGRYVMGDQAVRMNNRKVIFDEIDYTAGQVNQAINELPDTGFDAKSRAQVAAVLRDTDPKSAWSSFLTSEAAGTLTDSQVKYVTGLVSLQESAMGVKTVGGMPGASDLMRSAIIRMVPGSGTPSRSYAKRQMELFQGEVNQYRKSILNLGKQPDSKNKKQSDPLGILN